MLPVTATVTTNDTVFINPPSPDQGASSGQEMTPLQSGFSQAANSSPAAAPFLSPEEEALMQTDLESLLIDEPIDDQAAEQNAAICALQPQFDFLQSGSSQSCWRVRLHHRTRGIRTHRRLRRSRSIRKSRVAGLLDLCHLLREVLEPKPQLQGLRPAEKLAKKKQATASLPNVPQHVKEQLLKEAEVLQAEVAAVQLQHDNDTECVQYLRNRLESLPAELLNHEDLQTCERWAEAIPVPPGVAISWRKKPAVRPGSPLFSLLVFVRNGVAHRPQLIEQGAFESKAQMLWFFNSKFPWLVHILERFVQDLRKAAEDPNISEGVRASMIDKYATFCKSL